MNIKLFIETSFIKTIVFNKKYFGIKSLICPKVLISRNVKLLKLGGDVRVEDSRIGAVRIGYGDVGIIDKKYQRTIWENTGSVTFKGTASLGIGMRVANSGELVLGRGCYFNGNSDIICCREMIFGEECLVSWECLFMDTDWHYIYNRDTNEILNPDRSIIVGNHCWIGCRTTVLKGTVISDESVIAACSLISRKLEKSNCIYSTSRTIKENIRW